MNLLGERPAVKMTWYDGGNLPPKAALRFPTGKMIPKNGSIFVGEKGDLFMAYNAGPFLLPQENFKDHAYPKTKADNHYHQWVNAIRGDGKTTAPIDTYSGGLTETVLLGNLAMRFPGKTLKWDSAALKVTNVPEADPFIRETYRKGWSIEGLG